jgi:acyl-homoserine lactone acylase PvdQ
MLSASLLALLAACSGGRDAAGGGATTGDGTSGDGSSGGEVAPGAIQSGPVLIGSGPSPDGSASDSTLTTIRIARDNHGVAMVSAPSDAGALYGLGWAHAHDRLAQMTWGALAVQGRLAEFLGDADLLGPDKLDDRYENTVAHDLSLRRRGLWRLAQRVVSTMDAETVELLEAYCAGVQARVASMATLPRALTDFGVVPQAWTPAHCVAVWLQAAELYAGDGLNKAKIFNQIAQGTFDLTPMPDDPEAGVVQEGDVEGDWIDAVRAFASSVGLDPNAGFVGSGTEDPAFSHAWAVRRSGGAVLVGEPRIPVMLPSLLHEWALHGDTLHARGWGFVGAPVLLAGFSEDTAWSVTSAGLHQIDIFILDRVGMDRIRIDGEVVPIEAQVETLAVAGGPSRTVLYEETAFGPLIDDLLPGTGPQWRYAWLHPAFHDPTQDPLTAGFAAMRAETVEQQRLAGHLLPWPSLNRIFADRHGEIGYGLTGAVPVRSAANATALETAGIAAQYGSPPGRGWQGLVPPHLLPQTTSPAAPVVFSANHRTAGSFYPLPLGGRALAAGDSARSRRIRELAAQLTPGGPAEEWWDLLARDTVDPNLRDLVGMALLAKAQGWSFSTRTEEALPFLQAWLLAGASLRLDEPMIGLAGAIDRGFRDPDLSEVHGEGENGFCRLARRVEVWRGQGLGFADWPQADLIAVWLDDVLSEAADLVAGGAGAPLTAAAVRAASQAYCAAHEHLTLPAFAGAEGLEGLAPWADASVGPLICPDKQTLWSQHLDTVSFFVDLRTPDEARATVAPGSQEPGRTHAQSGVADWLQGTTRPIPLSEAAFPAVTEVVLSLP